MVTVRYEYHTFNATALLRNWKAVYAKEIQNKKKNQLTKRDNTTIISTDHAKCK